MHIVINNRAHESVGAMPTGCGEAELFKIAEAAGYRTAKRICDEEGLTALAGELAKVKGPAFYEIMVTLDSRADLSRPSESARENRDAFMKFLDK